MYMLYCYEFGHYLWVVNSSASLNFKIEDCVIKGFTNQDSIKLNDNTFINTNTDITLGSNFTGKYMTPLFVGKGLRTATRVKGGNERKVIIVSID